MAEQLYNDLGSVNKILVEVECASHRMAWESQHKVLHRASGEWLRKAAFAGQSMGSFFVDTEGVVYAAGETPTSP